MDIFWSSIKWDGNEIYWIHYAKRFTIHLLLRSTFTKKWKNLWSYKSLCFLTLNFCTTSHTTLGLKRSSSWSSSPKHSSVGLTPLSIIVLLLVIVTRCGPNFVVVTLIVFILLYSPKSPIIMILIVLVLFYALVHDSWFILSFLGFSFLLFPLLGSWFLMVFPSSRSWLCLSSFGS
jgi:hypothetical protein